MIKQQKNMQKGKLNAAIPSWMYTPKVHYFLIIIVSILLYVNTISHDYTQDDAIVIYDNMFTQQGIRGIPGLFSNDSFFGFFKDKSKATLVEGGRYRPLTLAMFAIETEIFGRGPKSGHIFNILWYTLLGLLIYHCCILLFNDYIKNEAVGLFAFLTVMIFITHPIHTEVVANIKGRDEILSLFFSVASFICILKYGEKPAIKYLFGAALLFFAGLLSKENTITFLAVIPAGLVLFKKLNLSKAFTTILPLIIVTVLFILIRYSVLGEGPAQTGMRDLMNDPFIKWNGNAYIPFDWSEKYATISYTMGKYLQLLLFPHPLTHDYYPRQIPIMEWANWHVILSILSYLALIFWAIFRMKKHKLFSFAVLYFIATISIVSNLVFPVGTNMAERFLFMPSLGFAILIGHGIFRIFSRYSIKISSVILASLIFIYGWKTIERNQVWKNDYTLFTTDVLTSVNSAKVLNAAGGALSTSLATLEDEAEKALRIETAIGYLERAIEIHPRYRNAYLLLGNCYYYAQDYPKAIEYYNETLRISPGYADAIKNRRNAYRDAGRYFGEKVGDLNQALFFLKKAYDEMPGDIETIRLLGVCHGLMQNHEEAIALFKKWTALSPENAYAWRNLMAAYGANGDDALAAVAKAKAISLDPEIFTK